MEVFSLTNPDDKEEGHPHKKGQIEAKADRGSYDGPGSGEFSGGRDS